MKLGFCNEDEKADVRELYAHAFEDAPAFIDYYFDEIYRSEQVMAIREDGHLVSMLHMNPYKVILHDHIHEVAYIVAVATRRDYRNRGMMGQTIDASLRFLYNRGDGFCLLMPIDSRIYERYGFGFIEDHLEFSVNMETWTLEEASYATTSYEAAQIVNALTTAAGNGTGSSEKLQLESALALKEIVEIYKEFALKCSMATIRDEGYFIRLLKELAVDDAQLIKVGDGYVVTYYMDDLLHVRECIVNDMESLKQIGSWLKTQTGDGRIAINDYAASPLKYYFPNIAENKIEFKPFMMGRIVNLKAFLNTYPELLEDGVRVKVVDDQIPENNGVYEIAGRQVVRKDTGDYDYSLSIKALTQLLFGYVEQADLKFLDPNYEERLGSKPLLKNGIKKKPLFFNEYV